MTGAYAVRFHPKVRDDLRAIVAAIAEHAGQVAALRRLAEIEATAQSLALTPHKGTLRDEIAAGLRAIPAGRRGVIAFSVDDAAREVRVHAIGYGGSDWLGRVRARS